MPRLRWIVVAVAALLVVLGGAVAAYLVVAQDRPEGLARHRPERRHRLRGDTDDAGPGAAAPEEEYASGRLCWRFFGGDPQRSLARPKLDLGLPKKPLLWTRTFPSYIEYPPSYCDGKLYVNTFEGETVAMDADTGRILWTRRTSAPRSPRHPRSTAPA